ncbi:MAG: transposase [Nitrososphaerales archaeon]
MVPSTYSSGGVTRHGRITREGSRWLRWAMVETAMTHIKHDTAITRGLSLHSREEGQASSHSCYCPQATPMLLFGVEE